MQTAGIIIEYNPLHRGHIHLLEEIRRRLGADTAMIGVMSGDFVQRGDFAILRRQARARAAVESGMDLVLELPLPWALSSAEGFADGGVQLMDATGLVTHLAFGSEHGDEAALLEIAACLNSEAYQKGLRRCLEKRLSFAASRQAAVEELLGREKGALLAAPNSNLGVEYCRALLRRNTRIQPLALRRQGSAHDSQEMTNGFPSATLIRSLLQKGQREQALSLMAPAMAAIYEAEEAAGRTPVFLGNCERAILARLRSMNEADFAALDSGREGLYRRLYTASRTAASVEEVLCAAKTKRYAHARLRRMVLWAYLELTPADLPKEVPYLRVLATNARGCGLLSRMRRSASVPVLTKPADVRRLSPFAQEIFSLEARAADLYALAYPDLSAAAGGTLWREGPVIL